MYLFIRFVVVPCNFRDRVISSKLACLRVRKPCPNIYEYYQIWSSRKLEYLGPWTFYIRNSSTCPVIFESLGHDSFKDVTLSRKVSAIWQHEFLTQKQVLKRRCDCKISILKFLAEKFEPLSFLGLDEAIKLPPSWLSQNHPNLQRPNVGSMKCCLASARWTLSSTRMIIGT